MVVVFCVARDAAIGVFLCVVDEVVVEVVEAVWDDVCGGVTCLAVGLVALVAVWRSSCLLPLPCLGVSFWSLLRRW